jgi:hypothetical protein
MSERTLTHNQSNTAVDGQETLESLSASKDLHKQARSAVDKDPANQSDLSSASISSADVLRASPRTEMRQGVLIQTSTSAVETTRAKGRSRSSTGNKEVGLFKNPHWEYSGGIVSKFITFLANLFKVLERLILKLLGGGDVAPLPKQGPMSKTPKEAPSSKEPEQERKEREKNSRSMHTHRS